MKKNITILLLVLISISLIMPWLGVTAHAEETTVLSINGTETSEGISAISINEASDGVEEFEIIFEEVETLLESEVEIETPEEDSSEMEYDGILEGIDEGISEEIGEDVNEDANHSTSIDEDFENNEEEKSPFVFFKLILLIGVIVLFAIIITKYMKW